MANEQLKSIGTGEVMEAPQGTFKKMQDPKSPTYFLRSKFTLEKEDTTPAEAKASKVKAPEEGK